MNRNKRTLKKTLALAMTASMAAGLCPTAVFAVTGGETAADGVYSASARAVNEYPDEDEWSDYDVNVDLTVENGVFTDIAVTGGADYSEDNQFYLNKAYSKNKGIKKILIGQAATEDTINSWDIVSGATFTSKAVKEAALAAIQSASAPQTIEEDPEEPVVEEEAFKYVYAGLSWAEYWEYEGISIAEGSSLQSVSGEADSKGELDKGAFDTVSRATTVHGLHRGSFQSRAVIYDTEGKSYAVSHWVDGSHIALTDGSTIGFSRGTITYTEDGAEKTAKMDHYEILGMKYIPVKVAAEDYEAFCAQYPVTENGAQVAGGYSENKLAAYSATAEVTEDTNGLKTAMKNEDGSFSFSTAETGTGSGLAGVEQKKAEDVIVTVKPASGSYGEFLRVDLTGNYGDLGSNMYAVRWDYYGDDSSYGTKLASYGTKFAADNWMHKVNGIQLGLTDSLRCQLPAGTDGSGYWSITVKAMGYEDFTFQFAASEENIVKPEEDEISTAELEAAINDAEKLSKDNYTAESWSALQTELTEAKDELREKHSQSAVDEAIAHLRAAIAALKEVEKETYVLMNIPYAEFYKADVNNTVPVDAFSSATLNKTRTGSLVSGSYHIDPNGTDITGVTFPVKVGEGVDLSKYTQITNESTVDITVTNRGRTTTTTYTGSEALFESGSYSYYLLGEKPSYYKEVNVAADGTLSFGKTVGEAQQTEGVSAELMTRTGYGDYQINLEGVSFDTSKIYGVILSTADGASYGLRHMENIWRGTELSWSSGFTKNVHGCPTSWDHYVGLMGSTITGITYYTADGIHQIPVNLYVPTKFDYTLQVSDAVVSAGQSDITITGLPSDFDAQYSVEGLKDSKVEDGKLVFAKDAAKGRYTLTLQDKAGKYADITTQFVLYTDKTVAAYDNAAKALKAPEGVSAEEFADYLNSITAVSVNGNAYAASGRGATTIINKEDGTIKTDAEPIAEQANYEMTVTATGYLPITFTYSNLPEVIVITVDKASITKVASADYQSNRITWKAVEGADGYRVYYKEGKGKLTYLKQLPAKTTAYKHTKLKTGTKYTYYVRAFKVSAEGEKIYGDYSAGKAATPTLGKAAISSVKEKSKKVTVSWKPVKGASGYRVYYKTSKNGSWKMIKQVKSSAKSYSYTNKKFKKGQTVYYSVRAYRTVNKKQVYGAYATAKTVKIK